MNHANRFHDTLKQPIHGRAVDDTSAKDRVLIVVRHGHAGDKAHLDGPDLLRPLSPLFWPKGSTWLLLRRHSHVRALHLPPPALDPIHAP